MACSPQPIFNMFINQYQDASSPSSSQSSPVNPAIQYYNNNMLPEQLRGNPYLQKQATPLLINNSSFSFQISNLDNSNISMNQTLPIFKINTQTSINNQNKQDSFNYEQDLKVFNEAFNSDFADFLNRSPKENFEILTLQNVKPENVVQEMPSEMDELDMTRENSKDSEVSKKSKKISKNSPKKESKKKTEAKKEEIKPIVNNTEELEKTFPKFYISYFYKILQGTCHPKLQAAFGNLDKETRNRFINFMRLAHKCRTWNELRTYIEVDSYLELISKTNPSVREALISFVNSFESIPTFVELTDFLRKLNISGEMVAQYFLSNTEADGRVRKVLNYLMHEIAPNGDAYLHWLNNSVLATNNTHGAVELVKDLNKQMKLFKEFQGIVLA